MYHGYSQISFINIYLNYGSVLKFYTNCKSLYWYDTIMHKAIDGIFILLIMSIKGVTACNAIKTVTKHADNAPCWAFERVIGAQNLDNIIM